MADAWFGRTLSHYEIGEKLGEGGMGVVYKARDTRLNRFVAVKLLPPEKLGDEERLRRFTQEARTASALNHPNIITIHDIASDGATPFIVMEYVAGKTLDQLIPRKGMRLGELLKIGVQIADALAAAAAAGVIHRDIKPGNVMVTDSGLVKVLDFGLAKPVERAHSAEEATATLAMAAEEGERPRTRGGMVIGTVSYMSPEQAESKPLDPRSDIFSFGALLFEMTTGQRAFRGATSMSTISSILRDEPARPGQLAADVPRDLEKIIARCLRKDPDRRFQHMSDVRVALLELKEESESGSVQYPIDAPPRKAVWPRWTLAASAVLLAAAGVVVGLRLRDTSTAPLAALHTVPLTNYSGRQGPPSLSPDGNQVAFTWTGDQGNTMHLYVKLIGNDTPLRLTADTHEDRMPAWAPDGKSIAFLRGLENVDVLYQISPIGGTERRIAELTPRSFGRPSWSRDGKSLVVSAREAPGKPSRIFVIGVDTGEKRLLSFGETQGEYQPALSPDSRRLAFTRQTGSVLSRPFVVDLDERLQPKGAPRQLNTPSGSEAAWTSDGKSIVFLNMSRGTLWIVPAAGSAPARELAVDTVDVGPPSISLQGKRMALLRIFQDLNIWRFPIAGTGKVGEPAPLVASTRQDRILEGSYSPDGSKIAFESNRSGVSSIWVANADGANPRLLSGHPGSVTGSPTWSPDGRWIAFDSRRDGNPEIYVISSERGAVRRLTNHPADDILPYWSHDGKWIYFTSNRSGKFEIYKAPAGGGDAVQLTHKTGWAPQESADGRYLYYTRGLPTSTAVYSGAKSPLLRLPVDGGQETQVADLVVERCWAVARQGIWFLFPIAPQRTELRFLDTATGKVTTAARISLPAQTGLTLSPDGRALLYNQIDHAGTEILLVENFN